MASQRLINPLAPDLAALPDYEIIERVKGGELALYEVLVRKHNEKLYRMAWTILKDEEEVLEAVQDTYVKAYEKLHQFKGDAKFSTWLIRIVINAALAKVKENNIKHSRTVSMDQLEAEVLLQEDNAEQQLIRSNVRKMLETTVDDLPDKYRMVFMMRSIEGLSVAETADCLEISEENVKVRLFRAKAMLREALKNDMESIELFPFKLDRCNVITDAVMHFVLGQS